jgi:hypothetical protein
VVKKSIVKNILFTYFLFGLNFNGLALETTAEVRQRSPIERDYGYTSMRLGASHWASRGGIWGFVEPVSTTKDGKAWNGELAGEVILLPILSMSLGGGASSNANVAASRMTTLNLFPKIPATGTTFQVGHTFNEYKTTATTRYNYFRLGVFQDMSPSTNLQIEYQRIEAHSLAKHQLRRGSSGTVALAIRPAKREIKLGSLISCISETFDCRGNVVDIYAEPFASVQGYFISDVPLNLGAKVSYIRSLSENNALNKTIGGSAILASFLVGWRF